MHTSNIKHNFDFRGKNVAVFGLGVSGVSAIKLLVQLGAIVEVYNQGEVDAWYVSQKLEGLVPKNLCFTDNDDESKIKIAKNSLIILSPGIPREHELLELVHQKKIPVWAEIELGYEFCDKPIVAITGTNGKTTTTTLIGELLEKSGVKAFVGGNIGTPFCEYARLKPSVDVVVLELSSFQLESIVNFRPKVALFLNLFQNHGERYSNIEDYGLAKARIALNMEASDVLIYAEDYPFIKNWAQTTRAKKIAVNTDKLPDLFDKSKLKVPGHHNVINAVFAMLALKELGLDLGKLTEILYSFKGVHHRIEFVNNPWGFLAYDDAKSTNWDATLTALKAVWREDTNVKLILGGKKRGHGDSILPYITEIKKYCKELLLIGEMGRNILDEIEQNDIDVSCRYVERIENAVRILRVEKFQGTLLFSPAFPSFDQFKNYEERGRAFQKALAPV